MKRVDIKKIFIIVVTCIFTIITLTSCSKKSQSDTDIVLPTDETLVDFIEETMKEEPREPNEIQIIKAEIVAVFKENDYQVVLANIYKLWFIPRDTLFESSSGAMFPVEIHYKIVEGSFLNTDIVYTMDGSGFSDSVKKMSRNNMNWYNKLMRSQNSYHRIYNPMIEKLKSHIQASDMKNYIHEVNNIPGYKVDVFFFEDLKNEPKGNVAVVKKEEYYEAKEQIGKENWPHYKGVLFNKATGIAIDSVFDEFPK